MITKIIFSVVLSLSFGLYFLPQKTDLVNTYAVDCKCVPGTGVCGGADCSPSIQQTICGTNDNVCETAQERYACENLVMFEGNYLCPTGGTASITLAKRGAWSEVFKKCFCTTGDMIQQILNIAMYVVSGIALILLALGAIKYYTANNNPDELTEAKEMVTSAIVGLVLVMLSISIITLLNGQLPPSWGINFLNIP